MTSDEAERWAHFLRLAERDFSFLVDELGYRPVSSKPPFVTYESERCEVSLLYDVPGRHELDVAVRRMTDRIGDVPLLGIDMIVALFGDASSHVPAARYVFDVKWLDEKVPRMAVALRHCGDAILRGDEDAWRRVDNWRKSSG